MFLKIIMKLPKINLNRELFLLVAVFLFAFFVRFYNFPNRVTFWSEQARSLVVSSNYIKEKPSLLGQEYFRVDSNGHKLFTGALFNYSLVPLLLISNYDPISITAFFALLNIFTGFVIYWVVKQIFGEKTALLSTVLFLFSDYMIYHSLFIWNYNFLPLVGIFAVYLTWLLFRKPKKKYVFLLGLAGGIGVSLQFLFLPLAGIIFLICFWRSKNRVRDTLLFATGMILGNLPMFIFDLKHNFYHMRTLWQYGVDTLNGRSDAGYSYYYLLPLWPFFVITASYVLIKILRLKKLTLLAITALYLYANINSPKVSFSKPTGMPEGLATADIDRAGKIIASDSLGNFNVAEVLDFDKRAYVLRYFVEYKYGKKPMGELSYDRVPTLYVLALKGYNFFESGVWEINAGGPYKISLLTEAGTGYAIYKLQK